MFVFVLCVSRDRQTALSSAHLSEPTLPCENVVYIEHGTRAGFCWWGPRGQPTLRMDHHQLFIGAVDHINDIYFGGAPTGGGPGPWPHGPPKSGPARYISVSSSMYVD